MVTDRATRWVVRGAVTFACLSGAFGSLFLLGAFGPVSCWTGESGSSTGPTVTTHGCEAGIDYRYGSTGGNVGVLFFWAAALLALVAFGAIAAWTGHRRLMGATSAVGAAVSILGLLSIGWAFVLPTLSLAVAAVAMGAGDDENSSPA